MTWLFCARLSRAPTPERGVHPSSPSGANGERDAATVDTELFARSDSWDIKNGMAVRKKQADASWIVSDTSGCVLEVWGPYHLVQMAPRVCPTPPRQRWSRVDGALVNGNGYTLVLDDNLLSAQKKLSGTPVEHRGTALCGGARGPFVNERDESLVLDVGKKQVTRWSLEPATLDRFAPSDDESENERRTLYCQAESGESEAQNAYAKLFVRATTKNVRVRSGSAIWTLDELLGRLRAEMTLDLIKPFAAPLFWSPGRSRLLMADCAERVVDVFDQSSYGNGQGARAIAAGRGLVSGEAGAKEVERAQKAARAVEPWDDVKEALAACTDCLDDDAALDPSWSLGRAREVRRINPRSLDDKLTSKQAVSAERRWQTERLWGYLSGALWQPTPSDAQRRLLAAQRALARVQQLRKSLLAEEKPLRAQLAKAQAARDKDSTHVLREALTLLR